MWSSLFWCWSMEIIHDFFQLKQEVRFELRPRDPGRYWKCRSACHTHKRMKSIWTNIYKNPDMGNKNVHQPNFVCRKKDYYIHIHIPQSLLLRVKICRSFVWALLTTHIGCPVLATWHKNCSRTGQVFFLLFFSKSVNAHMKNSRIS